MRSRARAKIVRHRRKPAARRRRLVVVVEHGVLGQGEVEDEAVPVAILRDVPDAAAVGLPRRGMRHLAALEHDAPIAGPAHAGERFDELGLAVSVDAGDAQDLALPQGEGHAPHGIEAAVVAHPEVVDLQDDLARRAGCPLDLQQDLAPDHELGQAALRGLAPRQRPDALAAPQHGDAVGHLEDLVELVGDHDHGRAALAQLVQHAEQLPRLLRREHGGGLVEDEHARVPVQGLEDLGALLHADADVAHARPRVDREPVAVGELLHPRSRPPGGRAGGRSWARRRGRCSRPPS